MQVERKLAEMDAKPTDLAEDTSSPKTNFSVDTILAEFVHPNGLWQWMVTMLLAFSTPSPATFPVYVHSAGRHRCRMEDKVEAFIKEQNITFERAAKLIDPFGSQLPDHCYLKQPGCQRYRVDWETMDLLAYFMGNASELTVSNTSEVCPNGYVFDKDPQNYPNTITAEFDALCGRAWLAPLGTSIYMFGMLYGFLVGGWSGDRFGRRRTLIGFCILEIIAAGGVSLAPNFAVYTLLRAVVAIGHTVKISVGGVLVLEITMARYRSMYGGILALFLDFVYRGSIPLWAFLIPSWRWLNVVVMSPSLLVIFYFYALPESPRWLMSQYRYDEALKVLQFGQRVNCICSNSKITDIHTRSATLEQVIPAKVSKAKNRGKRYLPAVFRNCQSAKITVLAGLVVFGIAMSFFGILFYAEFVKGSVYLVGFYNSLTAIPAAILATLAYHCIQSRKLPLMAVLTIATVCMTVSSLYSMLAKPSTDLVLTIGSNIALMMINIAICMIYVYIPELFPSDTRTSGFGIVFAFSRLGTIICTHVNDLDKLIIHGLPLAFYAGTTVLVLILLVFLKDVNGCNLPDVTSSSTRVSVNKECV